MCSPLFYLSFSLDSLKRYPCSCPCERLQTALTGSKNEPERGQEAKTKGQGERKESRQTQKTTSLLLIYRMVLIIYQMVLIKVHSLISLPKRHTEPSRIIGQWRQKSETNVKGNNSSCESRAFFSGTCCGASDCLLSDHAKEENLQVWG